MNKNTRKYIIDISLSALLTLILGLGVFSFKDTLFAAYERIGTTLSTLNLRFESPKSVSFHTNLGATEGDSDAKMRMIVDDSGNVGIGTSSPTDAKLHVNGTIRLDNPIQSYHALTKQYVDDEVLTYSGVTAVDVHNCSWTSLKNHAIDQDRDCQDYGKVMVGMDWIEDNDYMRYRRLLCCSLRLQ